LREAGTSEGVFGGEGRGRKIGRMKEEERRIGKWIVGSGKWSREVEN
jgi:hypothetical protein